MDQTGIVGFLSVKHVARTAKRAHLIGIGESTHGTHEFFDIKSALFKELVKECGYNTLLFEDNIEQCKAINNYIHSGNGNLKKLMAELYPVWRTQELMQLLSWMKEHSSQYPINFVGFDIDQSVTDISKRDEYMAKNIRTTLRQRPEIKALVWAHNYHISTAKISGTKPMGLFLRQWFGKNYFNIAQLFGTGTFSATHINKRFPDSKDRTLRPVKAGNLPDDFLENVLNKLSNKPFFLELTNEVIKQNSLDRPCKLRSIGWGLVPDKINDYTDTLYVNRAYDSLIYFPVSTQSMPL